MPRCCNVAGCKSNYRSQHENVSTFSLPKDEKLRNIWLRKIPTDFSQVSKPIVCIKHFPDSSVIRTEQFIVDGEIKTFARSYPKLKPDAVPSIFPNLPGYLSTPGPSSRRLCDAEKENLDKAIEASLEDFRHYEEEKTVHSVSDISEHFSSNRNKFKQEWTYVKTEGKLVMCLMNVSDAVPVITGSVCILNNLSIELAVDGLQIPKHKVPQNFLRITNKNSFDELLQFVENSVCDENGRKVSAVNAAVNILQRSFSSDECTPLQFLIEQIKFLDVTANNRRYSGDTLLLAASIYVHSSSAYKNLHRSGHIYLPHPSNLQKLLGKFDLSTFDINGSIEYLSLKKKYLKDHELLVNVLLDEIYIEPRLTFKGDTIFGVSKNNQETAAKTAQVFMISSVVSKYKDVVSIVPVHNLTADQLKSMLLHVVREIENIGFTVLSLVSDNNAVNRKAFELLTPNRVLQPSIVHPVDSTRKLFIIFDTVHILKCVRNNWIAKGERCLKYPVFDDFQKIVTADFKHLEQLYKKEKDSLVKYGHLLSFKVLYPSTIQKQNVNLALKVFDDRNVAALKCMSSNDTNFANCEHTAAFLAIICNWWHIVNVKSAFEGQRFNNVFREPIRADSILQLDFLKKMSLWLKNWRQSVPKCESLSPQTFQSLINTIDSFLLLIPYLFQHHKVDYILLSKFQSDNLEGRFSSYRQLSGANYYISYMQLLESERKLRFKDTLLLCSQNQHVPLKTLLPCSDSFNKCVNIEQYSSVLECDFDMLEIPDNVLPILVYISGYSVKKELFLKKCSTCSFWVQTDREVEISIPSDFLEEYDRGKLTLPTECSVQVAGLAWFMMERILGLFSYVFLNDVQQLSVLHKICCLKLDGCDFPGLNLQASCECKRTLSDILQKINLRSCKILMNNLTKKYNDLAEARKCNRQLKKLRTT